MNRNGRSPNAVDFQTTLLSLLAFAVPLERFQKLFEQCCRMAWGLQLRSVTVEGLNWSFLDNARNCETVMFVHGFGADKYRWGNLLGELGRRYRIVSPDLPGFGKTERPDFGFGVKAQIRRLIRFMDAVGIDQCHIVGTSMGGLIGSMLASAYPKRVERMVLMAPANMMAPEPSLAIKLFLCEGRNLFMFRNESEFKVLVSALYHRPPWISRPLLRHFARTGLEERPLRQQILDDLLEDGMDRLEDRLERIKARTLILWGDSDQIFDPSAAWEIAKRIPEARLQIIADCGHNLFSKHRRKPPATWLIFYPKRWLNHDPVPNPTCRPALKRLW